MIETKQPGGTKLTPVMIDILLHRLAVADCICESYSDGYGDDTWGVPWPDGNVSGEDINTAAIQLETYITEHRELPPITPKTAMSYVLWDCIDGSTYLACAYNAFDSMEISPQRYYALCAAGDKLARIVSHIVGTAVRISHH